MNVLVKPAVPGATPSAAEPESATRRGLIVSAAVSGGALLVGCSPSPGMMLDVLSLGADKPAPSAFGPFIRVSPDGWVTVINKHQDMGQGNHAGLAAIVAEELDADWDKVKVEFAPANAKIYANTLAGAQITGGSTAINNSWDQLRLAGAAARAMLVGAAAARWGVSHDQLSVKDGVVAHAASGRVAGFGDLAAAAGQIAPPRTPTLKDPKAFTLVGTDRVRRKDNSAKSTGAARYTQDVHLPDMLTAMVAHPTRFGATPVSFDDSATRKVPGVVDVVKLPSGVAVIARTTYAARMGREALVVVWDEDKAEKRSSDQILADYKQIAAGRGDPALKPHVFQSSGDATGAFEGELFEAAYDFPFLAHAAMEPLNCVAQVDGLKVKLTFGSQGQTLDQLNVATAVGTLPGLVEIETLPAGGSFGRRAALKSDYVVECARIAKHLGGRPVKLVWTREDDMTGGLYRPMVHHALAIKTGPDGFPAAWRHRIVVQSIMAGSPLAKGFDTTSVEGAMGSPYLAATPVVDAQAYQPAFPVPISWWRSVGATHTAMVMEHTIDQLARRAGQDPVDYRRALYRKAKAGRQLAALNLAMEKVGAAPPPAGWARGVAVHESFGSVVAQVAEVTVKNGVPRVGRVVCAIDCGTPVAPDLIAAQMEGGVCYGLSAALYGQITLKDGRVQESNFDRYRVLRMNEAPTVETYIVPSTGHPTGAGEPGTPLIAPAVANALLVLTGKPTNRLPFVSA